MNDTLITLQGNLGGDVEVRPAGQSRVATFRVACTPRLYQKKTDEWVDGDTQWYRVNAWRALADHCQRSLRRGDPVFVHGRLRAQTWTNSAGIEVTSMEVEATVVGHDLTRGTSTFVRAQRAAPAPGADPLAAAAASAEQSTGAETRTGEEGAPAPAAA
jgi:single-strand DNA-binding protein